MDRGLYECVLYKVRGGDSGSVTDSSRAMHVQNDKRDWGCMGASFTMCGVVCTVYDRFFGRYAPSE